MLGCQQPKGLAPVEKQSKISATDTGHLNPSLPGLTADQKLVDELQKNAVEKRGHTPRTHHLDKTGKPRFTNRLIRESSPYLLQHAHNPVNWFPWGAEPFRQAQRLNRPVLLSVGYSTCHWCHVMESESFEDLEIAEFINRHFIAIKVDREERPDVDEIYMKAVYVLQGRGGWPMTVVMTPKRQPFFAGTYFPARDGDRGTRKGFLSILKTIQMEYETKPADIVSKASDITARLQEMARPELPGSLPTAAAIKRAVQQFQRRFDANFGGFSRAPKFPRPATLDLLMRYSRRTGDQRVLSMVTKTLQEMARGGINDQIGGGFHRYSVDRRWRVPHFEKMLYDNAQLAIAYTDAWQITARTDFASVVESTLDYIQREMTSKAGGFYSATDADSKTPLGHAEEGWFFTWTPTEIEHLVGAEGLKLLKPTYGITAQGDLDGRNVLYLANTPEKAADKLGITKANYLAEITKLKQRLYRHRLKRPPPILDDKIITSWNGLMISAFARAGRVFSNSSYIKSAERAARFLLKNLKTDDGRLLRTWRMGKAHLNGYLDDYAFVIAGLIELYETTGHFHWLEQAITLQKSLDNHFADVGGGYYLTSHDHEQLLVRRKPAYDGAEPSGNAISAMNLLRLYNLTTEQMYLERADRLFSAFTNQMSTRSSAHPALLSALEMRLDKPFQIVLVGPDKPSLKPMLKILKTLYLPNRGLAQVVEDVERPPLGVLPIIDSKISMAGQATAYVCIETVCERPTKDPKTLAQQLKRRQPFASLKPAVIKSSRSSR
ncbi:MAG: thioredoxin domain-containing protein [Myxococcota bacterium]|nr:thioredoxin domain-containing protein [Myxococcota bacterium]